MTLADQVRRSDEGISRRTLRLCAGVAALVGVSTVPTFLVDGILNGTPVMNGSARGTALVMLALALPVLVGLGTVSRFMAEAENTDVTPVLVCAPQLRAAVRRMVQPSLGRLPVLSYRELTGSAQVRSVGVVTGRMAAPIGVVA